MRQRIKLRGHLDMRQREVPEPGVEQGDRRRRPARRGRARCADGAGRAGLGREQVRDLGPDRRRDQAASPGDAIAALDLELTADEIQSLAVSYTHLTLPT